MKMTKAMGVKNPASGKNFIKALDKLIASVGCSDMKMSEAGITREELKLYPQRVHEVSGGGITCREVLHGESPKAFQCGMKVQDSVLIINQILKENVLDQKRVYEIGIKQYCEWRTAFPEDGTVDTDAFYTIRLAK